MQLLFELIKGNKNIWKLRSECLSVKLVDVDDINLCTIVCFSDGSFAIFKNNSFQSGYIIFLYRNNKSFSPITWKSVKTKRVAKNTLLADTIALQQVLEACFMIKSFICEIVNRQVLQKFLPIKYYIDDKYLIDSIHSTKNVSAERLQIDVCIVCEIVAKKEVTSVDAKVNLNLQIYRQKGQKITWNCLSVLKGNTGLLK